MPVNNEHKWVQIAYYTILLGIFAIVGWAVYQLFILLFGGFLLAFLARPLVDKIERRGYSREISTALFFLGFFLILGIFLYITVPILKFQGQEAYQNRDIYWHQIESKFEDGKMLAQQYISKDQVEQYDQKMRSLSAEFLENSKNTLLDILGAFLANISSLIFIPVVAFFFLIQGAQIQQNLMKHIPNRYFEMSLMMIHYVNRSISGYLRGQFLNCVAVGIIAAIGLNIIGVKGGIAIGLFAGLANAIPYLGPVVGALPAIVMIIIDPAASSPWWSVLVVFLVINIMDNIYIYPMTVGKSLQLHPLIAILGILFGGAAGGVLGMIIAVPLISIATKIFTVFHINLRFYRII